MTSICCSYFWAVLFCFCLALAFGCYVLQHGVCWRPFGRNVRPPIFPRLGRLFSNLLQGKFFFEKWEVSCVSTAFQTCSYTLAKLCGNNPKSEQNMWRRGGSTQSNRKAIQGYRFTFDRELFLGGWPSWAAGLFLGAPFDPLECFFFGPCLSALKLQELFQEFGGEKGIASCQHHKPIDLKTWNIPPKQVSGDPKVTESLKDRELFSSWGQCLI